ncbi:MAG: hypothetical protein C4326_05535 [Ignavibacteria bacterium]
MGTRKPSGTSEPILELNHLRFFLPTDLLSSFVLLPWQHALESWHDQGVKFLEVKSGLSRHVVRFIETGGRRFAVKETSRETAQREYRTYLQLQAMGIRTLTPIGVVERFDGVDTMSTPIGLQPYERYTAYLVTELMEKVVPDAFLYKRGFTKENRRRIWYAVIELFVEMHSRGVYWGDASLANMLIHFSSELEPELGYRTKLRAVLADAETVEIHPSLSETLRRADVEFFIESMLWMEADLRASGIVREPVITEDDQQMILDVYSERYEVEQEMRSFEIVTQIDVDSLLGDFDTKGYGAILLKHINEHKWYLSEREGHEVMLEDAAQNWYREVFRPVCRLFNEYDLSSFFPERTAASLYVRIMEHKYFMSKEAKKDVGIAAATWDYVVRFAESAPPQQTIRSLIQELKALFRTLPAPLQSLYT